MSWITPLVNEYYEWLKNNTVITNQTGSEWSLIQTPFIGLFNDFIEIYAKIQNDKITFSDNSETINNLETIGVQLGKNSERRKIVDRILLNYGLSQKDQELLLECNQRNFTQKKHNFISALIELNELYVLSKSSVASIFKDDVKIYLDNNNIIYTQDFISKGSTGLEFIFDFQIAKKKSEIVIKSFNSVNKQTLSAFLFSWGDIKTVRENATSKEMKAIAVINDEKVVHQRFLEALKSKGADYIIWSERFEQHNIDKIAA